MPTHNGGSPRISKGRQDRGPRTTREPLIRQAHDLIAEWNATASPSWVIRTVNKFDRDRSGMFAMYLAMQLREADAFTGERDADTELMLRWLESYDFRPGKHGRDVVDPTAGTAVARAGAAR